LASCIDIITADQSYDIIKIINILKSGLDIAIYVHENGKLFYDTYNKSSLNAKIILLAIAE